MKPEYICDDCGKEITAMEYERLDDTLCPECGGRYTVNREKIWCISAPDHQETGPFYADEIRRSFLEKEIDEHTVISNLQNKEERPFRECQDLASGLLEPARMEKLQTSGSRSLKTGDTFQLSKTVTAVFKNNYLMFKFPLHKKTIQLDKIRGYFIYPFITGQNMLVLGYEVDGTHKNLKLPLESKVANPFIQALRTNTPDTADLLDKGKKEALQILGTTDTAWISIMVALCLMLLLVVAMELPGLWHGFFDSHLVRTTVEELYSGTLPDSNYISFTAELGKQYVVATKRHVRTLTARKKGYFPLLPPDCRPVEPVKVVLMVDQRYLGSLNGKQGETFPVKGLIRNFLWEKRFPDGFDLSFSSGENWETRLARKIGTSVDGAILIDYQANPRRELVHAMLMIAFIMGIGIVSLFFLRNRRGE